MKIPDDFYRAVLIPASQAVITGVLAFCAGLAVCALGGWAWWYAAIGAGLIGLAAWLGFWGWWSRVILDILTPDRRLRLVEEPYSSEPDPQPVQPQTIRVELIQSQDGFQRGDYIDLPCQPDQVKQLADGLTRGQPFALSAWTGRNQVFSRSEFETVRVTLLKAGLLRWSSPHARAQGVELTPAGRAVMRRLAAPLPASDERE
jgi:hypothetical protein